MGNAHAWGIIPASSSPIFILLASRPLRPPKITEQNCQLYIHEKLLGALSHKARGACWRTPCCTLYMRLGIVYMQGLIFDEQFLQTEFRNNGSFCQDVINRSHLAVARVQQPKFYWICWCGAASLILFLFLRASIDDNHSSTVK